MTTKSFQGMLEQAEVAYVPLSTTAGKACANCRWFQPNSACFIVECEPESIMATGYCNRWEASPPPPPEPMEELADAIAEAVQEQTANLGSAIGDLSSAMMPTEMSHQHDDPVAVIIDPQASIQTRVSNFLKRQPLKDGVGVLKDNAGRRYMFMITSNGYQDRDNQHVATKAIEQYVDSCWQTEDHFNGKNAHYIWHMKELGSISDLMFADVWSGFLVELWREQMDNPIAKGFYNYVEKHPEMEWGASQGFFGSKADAQTGVFKSIVKYESTTLPRAAASNVLTLSEVLPMEKSKRDQFLNAFMKEEFGIEDAAGLLKQGTDKLRAAMQERGIQAKAVGDEHETVRKARAEALQQSAELMLSLVEVQDEFQKDLQAVKDGQATLLKAKDDQIASLTSKLETQQAEFAKQVNDLRTQINLPPARASQANSTVRTDAEAATLKDKLPVQDPYEQFIGLPMKKDN